MGSALIIPTYQLYGEPLGEQVSTLWVHSENISVRSPKNNWHITPHKHARLFQLLWMTEGEATVVLDGYRFSMKAHHGVGIPAGVVHGFQFSQESEGYVVSLDMAILHQLEQMNTACPAVFSQVNHVAARPSVNGLPALLACLHEHCLAQPLMSSCVLTKLAEALLLSWKERVLLAQGGSYRIRSDQSEKHFEKFQALLHAHFLKQKTVAWYASELGVSAEHLNVICRRVVKQTALSCIHERVMLEARRLLMFTHLNVEQVALDLGFRDAAYFSRFFKKKSGVSPRQFQREWQGQ